MSVAECVGGVWSELRRVPSGELPIHPAAMGIQFGQSVFEGCKAHRDERGDALLFRMGDHHQRLVASCERLCIAPPPRELFDQAVNQQTADPESWSSPFSSDTLYMRPVLFGSGQHLMPLSSPDTTFVVLTAPLRLFPQKPLALFAEREYSRAAKGGLGYAKAAANYAHGYVPTRRAQEVGCDGVLWLDASTHSTIEEASTMNIFVEVGDEVLTPALSDTILAGITRDSVITLLRDKYGREVTEGTIALARIAEAAERGTLKEIFTASTALGLRSVARIVDGEQTIAEVEEFPLTATRGAIGRGQSVSIVCLGAIFARTVDSE